MILDRAFPAPYREPADAEPEAGGGGVEAVVDLPGGEETSDKELAAGYAFDDPAFDVPVEEPKAADETPEDEEGDEGEETEEGEDDNEAASGAVDFPPELLDRASSFGYSAKDVLELGSPEAFRASLNHTERTLLALQQTQQPAAEPLPEYTMDRKALAEAGFDAQLLDELEKITSVSKTREASIRQELTTLRQLAESQQQAVHAASSREEDRAYDGFLATLGDEWKSTFGKGAVQELDPKSAEMQNRLRVLDMARVIEAGYRARGLQPPPRDELYQAGLGATFGHQARQIARKEVSNGVKRRAAQTVARPTSNLPVRAPEDVAASRVDEWRRAHLGS